jgi:hypothetical protein
VQPATQAWWFAAGRLLGTVLIGAGVGWLVGRPWEGLACTLTLHLAWVLANLFRLEWWLRHRSYADPLPQAALRAADAPAAAFHRGAP